MCFIFLFINNISIMLPSLPNELQIEILKQTDPSTVINFCKKKSNNQTISMCNDIFKFLL